MTPRAAPIVPAAAVSWYLPGENCITSKPGDLVLVHHYHSLAAKAIRFGEWLRPLNRPYCWTNHGCVVQKGGPGAIVIQEVGRGSVQSALSSFHDELYALVSVDATLAQRASAVRFAVWTLGSGYGYLSAVGDGLDDLTGLHLSFGTYGRMVCSAATCRAAERMGLIPDRDPTAVQPADLARYFNISNDSATTVLQSAN